MREVTKELLEQLDVFSRLEWVMDYKKFKENFKEKELLDKYGKDPIFVMELKKLKKTEVLCTDDALKKIGEFVSSKSENTFSIAIIHKKFNDVEIRAAITRSNFQWHYRESSITIDLKEALKNNTVLGELTFVSEGLIYGVARKDICSKTLNFDKEVFELISQVINDYFKFGDMPEEK